MKLLFLLVMAWVNYLWMSNNKIEEYGYSVEKRLGDIEIRIYEPATFSAVCLPSGSYDEQASRGFRTLAGYIFGGNETGESIAMTSPVMMELDTQIVMSFMVPKGRAVSSLPRPHNASIHFVEKPVMRMAAIRFGGWANDAKIQAYQQRLVEELARHDIRHKNTFAFLGYNPPYRIIHRRNEVVVELD